MHLFLKGVYNWKVCKTGKGEWSQEAISRQESSKNEVIGINQIVKILQKLSHPAGQRAGLNSYEILIYFAYYTYNFNHSSHYYSFICNAKFKC